MDIATESFLLGNVENVTIFLIYMENVLQIVYNDVDEGDGSVPTNIKSTIYLYIKNNFQPDDPIVQTELYTIFDNIKSATIRQTLIRLSEEDKIVKSDKIQGVYFLSNPNRILDNHTLNFKKYIEQKFLKDSNGEVIGYESGFNIANQLGLTTQVTNVSYIYSNAVADKLREVRISNRRFVINSPRITVTSKNYKLLQVLDLIGNFKRYSEHSIEDARIIFEKYLGDLKLDKTEINEVVEHYPLKTQLDFYKMEVDHVITSR